jgi:hypothetical protein
VRAGHARAEGPEAEERSCGISHGPPARIEDFVPSGSLQRDPASLVRRVFLGGHMHRGRILPGIHGDFHAPCTPSFPLARLGLLNSQKVKKE